MVRQFCSLIFIDKAKDLINYIGTINKTCRKIPSYLNAILSVNLGLEIALFALFMLFPTRVFYSKMLRSLQTSKNSTSTLSCLLVPTVAMTKGKILTLVL